VRAEAKWAFIDASGKIKIPARYFVGVRNVDHVCDGWWIGRSFAPGNIPKFAGGIAPVASDRDLFGFIDKDGNWLISPKFQCAENFSNGKAKVRLSLWGGSGLFITGRI
jgi:hypothetical protein